MADAFYDPLKPFVSLTLLIAPAAAGMAAAAEAGLAAVTAVLAKATGIDAQRASGAVRTAPDGQSVTRGLRYVRRVRPAWTTADLEDVQHHLVLVFAAGGYVALYLTDPRLQTAVTSDAMSHRPDRCFKAFEPVPRAELGAAFLGDGPTRTMWLTGAHGRTPLKANGKVLSGDDLEYALDPFDDQSFWWSAARARHTALDTVVGASSRASKVWLKQADSIREFEGQARAVLRHLADTAAGAAGEPYRVLAEPMARVNLATVQRAYDLSILPPDAEAVPEDTPEALEARVADALACRFTVTGAEGEVGFQAQVRRGDTEVGLLDISLAPSGRDKVTFTVAEHAVAGQEAALARIAAEVRRGEQVNVRYDSGHSISGRRVFSMRPRQVAFDGFDPCDFPDIDIDQEKPADMEQIGVGRSLFCWVKTTRSGWLACDDGAMEKADFIHIDDTADPPVLSFIHVKGSHSDNADREVSVSAYEVVTGQAVKNLVWLDKQRFDRGLLQRARAAHFYWKDGQAAQRDGFVAAAEALGASTRRRVIIVQPSLRLAYATTPGLDAANQLRLDQLHTLLASGRRSCAALGADLSVVCAR